MASTRGNPVGSATTSTGRSSWSHLFAHWYASSEINNVWDFTGPDLRWHSGVGGWGVVVVCKVTFSRHYILFFRSTGPWSLASHTSPPLDLLLPSLPWTWLCVHVFFCATDSTQQSDRVLNATLLSMFSLLFTKNKNKNVFKCWQCGTKTLCKTARKQFCSKI